MANEAKTDQPQPAPEETPAAKSSQSSGILKYVLFGAGGLLVVVVVMTVTLLLMQPGKATDAPAEPEHTDATAQTPPANSQTVDSGALPVDSIEAALMQDETVMDNIMANLEFLDYEPTAQDVADEETSTLTVEDSVEQTNWIKDEKKRLAEKETELEKRERELESLNREVTQKLTKLDQAESTRVSNLARLYDSMDPRSVAKLVANLDDKTVVSILPRMKTKNASSVLALMPAKRAARLSKQMITISEK